MEYISKIINKRNVNREFKLIRHIQVRIWPGSLLDSLVATQLTKTAKQSRIYEDNDRKRIKNACLRITTSC